MYRIGTTDNKILNQVLKLGRFM